MPPPIPPRWASTNAAEIVEPNEAKKDIGWLVGEKPPHGFFNWFKRRTYDCLAYMLPFFTDDGLKRIRRFANSTELKSIVAPAAGDLALGPGIGLYVFITTGPAAAAATDDLYYFAPNDGTPGRWVHGLALLLNQPLGLAKLDAAAKVPTAQLVNSVADVRVYAQDRAVSTYYGSTADTGAYTSYGEPIVTVPGCGVGDIIEIDGFVWAQSTISGGAIPQNYLRLAAGPSGGALAGMVGSEHLTNTDEKATFAREKVTLAGRFVVTAPGAVDVRLQGKQGPQGTTNVQLYGPAFLRAVRRVP